MQVMKKAMKKAMKVELILAVVLNKSSGWISFLSLQHIYISIALHNFEQTHQNKLPCLVEGIGETKKVCCVCYLLSCKKNYFRLKHI